LLGAGNVRLIEILLVEDNSGDVRLTMEAFREGKLANNLTVVSDGEQALAYLERKGAYSDATRPDLILLDLNLPKVSGQEVLAKIGQDPLLASVPVVVLTASRDEHDVLRSLRLGAAAYMTKPVDAAQLIQLVEEIHAFRLGIVTSDLAEAR